VNLEFLDVDDVLEIHASQIAEHGGSEGLRDRGLLESAVAQPMAAFGGQFLNEDLVAMAAALLVSLVKNQPFVDGKQSTALLAVLVLLDINGYAIERPSPTLEGVTLDVAAGHIDKDDVAEAFRALIATL